MEATELRIGRDGWESAVADADGRQIVVAGPGTGKTEFLVRRVEYLVASGKARREEIVVLCFSRRAAGDLRRRIEESIGATGVPVDVTTFHGLALRLIETARGGSRPVPLTTPEQVDVVHRLLVEEDPSNWPLPYRGILDTPAFATEVADFLLRCSERFLDPEDLARQASERADWKGIPALFDRYLATLSKTGRTDYGALLVSAATLLGTQEGRDLSSRYRYVLVDEYQDTSPVQAEMADLLASSSGNLTVAGDPYQSIYSFRGAELRNVDRFGRVSGTRRLVLEESFRVPSEILDSALRVVSGGDLPGAAGPVVPAPHTGRTETYVFDQETGEAEWIAKEVERSIVVEGIAPDRIAVLVRSKKGLVNELSRALDRRRVPHDPPDSRLVDHPAIRMFADLVTVSRFGGQTEEYPDGRSTEADQAMRRILLGPVFGLALGKERALLRERRRSGDAWGSVVERELPEFAGLASLLVSDDWRRDRSAVEGFWRAWTSLDNLDDFVSDPSRLEWRRAWSAFAQVLGQQAERDRHLDLERYFELADEEDFEATPLLTYRTRDQRVVLTTLHQAKGLEFDVVFIANAVEGVFPDLRRGRRMLKPELLSPERTTDPQAQHLFQVQEEMRIAYTAMTRSRLRVVWTATDAGVDQGEHRPSRFLVAAAGVPYEELGPPAESVGPPVTLTEAMTRMRRRLMDPTAPEHERLAAASILGRPPAEWWDAEAFPGILERGPDSPILATSFRLSPSQAESYRRCPRLYALERRLRLGDAASPWAHFGSLFHDVLERAESTIVGTGEPHADIGRALECLEDVWSGADFGTPELNDAWRVKAVDTLTKLYDNWPATGGTPTDLERRVGLNVAGAEWIGFIDRVEESPDGALVVDYKTSTSPMRVEDAAESIQLAFYSLAMMTEGRNVVDAQLWYPRAGTKSISRRHLDMDRLEEIRDVMVEVTEDIRTEQWEPNPGSHCERCSFRLSCPAWPEASEAYLP